MPNAGPDIIILDRRIERRELRRLVRAFFDDMVKYVRSITFELIGRGEEDG